MWINHLSFFEARNKGERRLVRAFYNTEGKCVKVFEPGEVTIPTELLHKDSGDLENVIGRIEDDPFLRGFPMHLRQAQNAPSCPCTAGIDVTQSGIRNYDVLEITLPHDLSLEERLPAVFHKREYNKIRRFRGDYPERKVSLSPEMEGAFTLIDGFQTANGRDKEQASRIDTALKCLNPANTFAYNPKAERYEAFLASSAGITYHNDFLTPDESKQVSTVYFDIEKCLWKHKDEKAKLDERERLLKQKKHLENLPMSKRTADYGEDMAATAARIAQLEAELTIDIDGLGKIPLYDKKFDAQVSWIIAHWKNPCNSSEKEITELFIIDPNDEFKYEKYKGATVVKARTEEELFTKHLLPRFRQRKPLYSVQFNGAYDNTQLRMGMNRLGEVFDPLVSEVEPKRDHVMSFIQRMWQDSIYIDLLWIAKNHFAPFLGQRSLGTNFKLESVARYFGYDFRKIMNHDNLRVEEVKRLVHPDPAVRQNSLEKLATYTGSDVGPLERATKQDIFEYLYLLKKEFPYCTTTQLAFSTTYTDWVHDFHHFTRTSTLRFSKYGTKERKDGKKIFNNRVQGMHQRNLEAAGVIMGDGEGRDVSEIYMPLEEFLLPLIYKLSPEFKRLSEAMQHSLEQRFALSQSIRAFAKDVMVDVYFASKEEADVAHARLPEYKTKEDYAGECSNLAAFIDALEPNLRSEFETIVDEDAGKFIGAFDGLKNLYRSIYVDLPGKARRLIRPTKENLVNINIPEHMFDEADLVLLHARAEAVKKLVSEKARKNVDRFSTTYNTFLSRWDDLEYDLTNVVQHPRVFSYAKMRKMRAQHFASKFYTRYGMPFDAARILVNDAYCRIADNLRQANARVVDMKGNYFFVEADSPVDGAYEVQRFPVYPPVIPSKPGEEKQRTEQLDLALVS